MQYSTKQTANSQLACYTKITEMQFLLRAFELYLEKHAPYRTTKRSIERHMDDFEREIKDRYMHARKVDLDDSFEFISDGLYNCMVHIQLNVLREFLQIVQNNVDTIKERITKTILIKKIQKQIEKEINSAFSALDTYRGCLF